MGVPDLRFGVGQSSAVLSLRLFRLAEAGNEGRLKPSEPSSAADDAEGGMNDDDNSDSPDAIGAPGSLYKIYSSTLAELPSVVPRPPGARNGSEPVLRDHCSRCVLLSLSSFSSSSPLNEIGRSRGDGGGIAVGPSVPRGSEGPDTDGVTGGIEALTGEGIAAGRVEIGDTSPTPFGLPFTPSCSLSEPNRFRACPRKLLEVSSFRIDGRGVGGGIPA